MATHSPYRPESSILPEYKVGPFGNWRVTTTHRPDKLALLDDEEKLSANARYTKSYRYSKTGTHAEKHFHMLQKQEEDGAWHTWMCTSMLEIESQVIHVHYATGTVVVVGVGMGMTLKAIADKPEVKRVLAIDIDPQIINFIHEMTDFEHWEGRHKITFLQADALALDQDWMIAHGFYEPDYLYVDIWPVLMDDRSMPDTQAVQEVLNAKALGFWGQEVEFIAWLSRMRAPQFKNNMRLGLFWWDKFQMEMGGVMHQRSANYIRYCLDCGVATVWRHEEET
jgi:hypothetical protein